MTSLMPSLADLVRVCRIVDTQKGMDACFHCSGSAILVCFGLAV